MKTPFSRRMLIVLFGVGAVSLAGALLLSVFADDISGGPRTVQPSAYSRSAIGHSAFVDVLRSLDVPVVVSQHGSGTKAGESSLLVIMEPNPVAGFEIALNRMIDGAGRTLVVLPKWRGIPDPDKKAWVRDVQPRNEDAAADIAYELLSDQAMVIAVASASSLANTRGYPAPTIDQPQLVWDDYIVPIIHSEAGVLLGEIGIEYSDGTEGTVWILSDPDILSNHGIGRGDNAELTVRIIDDLRAGGGVVIDETMHGYDKPPSIFREMFEFPLLLATLQALLTVAILLWAATGRFGSPRGQVAAIAPGKAFLIDNTASLLHFGGHGNHMLSRYLQTSILDVKRGLHLPATLWHAPLIERLDRIGNARGLSINLTRLIEQVTNENEAARTHERHVLLIANRIYRWKQEMLHGHSSNRAG